MESQQTLAYCYNNIKQCFTNPTTLNFTQRNKIIVKLDELAIDLKDDILMLSKMVYKPLVNTNVNDFCNNVGVAAKFKNIYKSMIEIKPENTVEIGSPIKLIK